MSAEVDLNPYLPDAPSGGRRRTRRSVLAPLVVLALVGAGTGVALRAAGDDGAGSPQEAARAMLEAVEASDVLGVLEALAPVERTALRQPLLDVEAELTRLEVLDEGFDPGAVAGVGVEVDEEDLWPEEVAPGIVAVHVEGAARASFDPASFPFGAEAVAAGFAPDDERDEADLADALDGEVFLVAVEDGGAWHVSAAYTVAEHARRAAEEAFPAEAVPARGTPEPEAAVRELIDASGRYDHRRMVELVDPVEGRVAHDYGALFEAPEEEELEGFDDGLPDLGEPELAVSGEGDRRSVTVTFPDAAELWSQYVSEAAAIGRAESGLVVGQGEMPEDVPPIETRPLRYELVRRDGAWYVSPTASVAATTLDHLRALEPGDLDETTLVLSPFALLYPAYGALDVSTIADPYTDAERCATDEGYDEACLDELVAAGELDAQVADDVVQQGVADECYAVYDELPADAADADAEAAERACLEAKVAAGELDASYLDGYREADLLAACAATGDPAAEEACLQGHVDAGELDPYVLESLPIDRCYRLGGDDAAVQACLEAGVAAGEVDPAVLAEEICSSEYDALPEVATDEEYEAVEDAVQRCLEANGA